MSLEVIIENPYGIGKMKIKSKIKAKELRKKSTKELMGMLSETDREIARFRSGTKQVDAMITLPTGPKGGINFGLFQTLKKNKAIILTVLTEKGFKRPGFR